MKFSLTATEIALLNAEHISFSPFKDYSEDEALDLLEQVREAEVAYSQCEDQKGIDLYDSYCHIGDKRYNVIPQS